MRSIVKGRRYAAATVAGDSSCCAVVGSMDLEGSFDSVRDVFGSTDLLAHILGYLGEPQDRDAACRVNKSWLHAFQSVPQQLAFRYCPLVSAAWRSGLTKEM